MHLGSLYGLPGQEGALADPRFAHPGGLPEFVPVAAGRFWMGDDESEEEDERPRHRVRLDTYELARFPTTNAMYARFVDAGGYDDPRWWAAAIGDGYWYAEEGFIYGNLPPYWDDARFNNPAQPVVGVTWYEAVAYCAWLTDTLDDGWVYRLPTEAEWECAARGDPPSPRPSLPEERGGGEGQASLTERRGRIYPWGDAWHEDHCNSDEAGLDVTSAVGIFARGAARGGIEDMAGNVWEWCHDWYSQGYYAEARDSRNPAGPATGELRVQHGGAFWNDARACWCGYRYRYAPGDGNNFGGFRCARAFSSVP